MHAGDPIATDTGDDDGGGADTSDTAPDIPPEWGPADLAFGPYNMRLIAVNQNTCTAEYTANATFEVEIIRTRQRGPLGVCRSAVQRRPNAGGGLKRLHRRSHW